MLTMMTILWYALHGHHPDIVAEHRARAPWSLPRPTPRSPTCSPSYAAPSSPRNTTPGQGRDLAPAEIRAVHQAWEAAGL